MPRPKEISTKSTAAADTRQTRRELLVKRLEFDKPRRKYFLYRRPEVLDIKAELSNVELTQEGAVEALLQALQNPKRKLVLARPRRGLQEHERSTTLSQDETITAKSTTTNPDLRRGLVQRCCRKKSSKRQPGRRSEGRAASKSEGPASKCIRFLAPSTWPPMGWMHRHPHRWRHREDPDNSWSAGTPFAPGQCCS